MIGCTSQQSSTFQIEATYESRIDRSAQFRLGIDYALARYAELPISRSTTVARSYEAIESRNALDPLGSQNVDQARGVGQSILHNVVHDIPVPLCPILRRQNLEVPRKMVARRERERCTLGSYSHFPFQGALAQRSHEKMPNRGSDSKEKGCAEKRVELPRIDQV